MYNLSIFYIKNKTIKDRYITTQTVEALIYTRNDTNILFVINWLQIVLCVCVCACVRVCVRACVHVCVCTQKNTEGATELIPNLNV